MYEENKENFIQISINHKGEDLLAVVTMEQSNLLLNDEKAAAIFAESLLHERDSESPHCSQLENAEVEINQKRSDVFTSKEATLLFLQLRGKYATKFDDKKTIKSSLWSKILADMKEAGFDVGEGKDAAEKCRQKFANLQRSYMNHMKYMKTTGVGKKVPPPYFEELHAILGHKDKVAPRFLDDSLESSEIISVTSESEGSCSNSEIPPLSSASKSLNPELIKNRFSSSRKPVKPNSNFIQVMELIKAQHEETRNDRNRHMDIFEKALQKQNDQRERFLQLMEGQMRGQKRKQENNDLDC